jgi:signal transduction histidine kinase
MSAVVPSERRSAWQQMVDDAIALLRDNAPRVLELATQLQGMHDTDPRCVHFGLALELIVPLFREDLDRESELMPLLTACEDSGNWECACLTSVAVTIGLRVRNHSAARAKFAAERLLRYIEQTPPCPARTLALNSMGVCASDVGDVDQAARWYYAALDEAQALGLTGREAHIRANIAELLYLCGNAEEARVVVAQGVAIADANGGGWLRLYTRTMLALCSMALGDSAAGVAAIDPMHELPEERWAQSPVSRAFLLAASALVLTDVGQLERANQMIVRGVELIEGQIEQQFTPYVWWARGHWLHAHGRLDEALADLQTALDRYDAGGFVFLPMRVAHEMYRIHRIRGEYSQALAMHERFHTWYDRVQSQSTRTRLQVLRSEHAVKNLQADAQRQRDMSAAKSRFIAMASHEFRTPLAAVQSSAELLRFYHERMDAAERERVLADLQHGVDRLQTTMEQVLLLARTDAGKLAVRREPLDWLACVHDVIAHMRRGNGGRNPLQLIEPDAELAALRPSLDRSLFDQALSNLISNACKYSEAGQTVWVRFERAGGKLVLEVRDQGIGIPLEDQARLFDSFERGSNALDIQGTGLGLAIVRRAAHAHDAQVSFESAPGAGSCFRLAFPVA